MRLAEALVKARPGLPFLGHGPRALRPGAGPCNSLPLVHLLHQPGSQGRAERPHRLLASVVLLHEEAPDPIARRNRLKAAIYVRMTYQTTARRYLPVVENTDSAALDDGVPVGAGALGSEERRA